LSFDRVLYGALLLAPLRMSGSPPGKVAIGSIAAGIAGHSVRRELYGTYNQNARFRLVPYHDALV